MDAYNILFSQQAVNAGECMPVGGHDVGCNVWVENNVMYLYIAQTGAFDELGNMVKAGRIRIDLLPNPFEDEFSQELKLHEGFVEVRGRSSEVRTTLRVWADTARSAVHVDIDSSTEHSIRVEYQNWRTRENAFKTPDVVKGKDNEVLFFHKNPDANSFQKELRKEGLEREEKDFPDVQKGLIFGGKLIAEGMKYAGLVEGSYAYLPYEGFVLEKKTKKQHIGIFLRVAHDVNENDWEECLSASIKAIPGIDEARAASVEWWNDFWKRSYIAFGKTGDENDVNWQACRNYQLFRYMLGCNAYGNYPTKFNGGLFTVDPKYWGQRYGASNPDERDWGGLIFTAQNQRHMYWPMLKTGDFDMMAPQFEFYLRLLHGAKARSKHFFGVEDAACIPEQTDANGLSAYYGINGLDYPIHVRYHYVTSVEFSYMMLKYIEATDSYDDRFTDFAATILNFYDQMYSKLDSNGKRIIFPSTAQETYHKAPVIEVWGEEGRRAANYNPDETAVTNPADVIYALRAVTTELLDQGLGTEEQRSTWTVLRDQLPPIPLEQKKGHTVIAPCSKPREYVKTNCEIPQLYPCYPYHEIGIGEFNNKDLRLAKDTYFYGLDDEDDQRMNLSWMHVGVFAARLGLVQEAYDFMIDKLKNSGKRFPAFWGPGHDYTPDHNWGGVGMQNLQEMVLQNFDGKIYLLPAWPRNLDVSFKLWVEHRTFIEATYKRGKLSYSISDKSREKDIVVCL
jgi:hypothetical protein